MDLSVKDFIRFRLTGEAYAELTDFSGANLVNLDACGYDRELLALFGLEELRPPAAPSPLVRPLRARHGGDRAPHRA